MGEQIIYAPVLQFYELNQQLLGLGCPCPVKVHKTVNALIKRLNCETYRTWVPMISTQRYGNF